MEKLRVAVLGAGKIGKYHVKEFSQCGAEVVAILGSTRESSSKTAEELKKEFGINVRPYYKIEEMIKWERLDVVSICTPPELHESQVRICLENNLHVICEKPFVDSHEDNYKIVEELFNLAEKRKKILTVNTQWASIVDYFKKYPDLEKLKSISMYMEPAERGIDMIKSFLPHANSVLIGLIPKGMIDDIKFLSKEEDFITIKFRFKNQETECDVRYDFKLRVKKPGEIIFSLNGESFRRDIGPGYKQAFIGNKRSFEVEDPLKVSIRKFLEGVKGTGTSLVCKKDILENIALAEKVISEYIVQKKCQNNPEKENTKIAVIGGGIFGSSIALELSKNFRVTLYERSGELLSGASTNNHLRHHGGYHYPRSKGTAIECLKSRESFEREYGACIIRPFNHYHAIAKEDSKTTPGNYLKFCEELGLPYEIINIDDNLINKEKVSMIVKVAEYAYDPKKMLEIIKEKLKSSSVKVKLNNKIIGGEIKNNKKILKIESPLGNLEEEFDFVINATYHNFNNFNKWFGLPRKDTLYELVEMIEIELPIKEKLGLSIFDGQFSTIMPRAEEGRFTLVHIRESVISDFVSDNLDPEVMLSNIKSNQENILKAAIADFPILKEARIIRPIYVIRAIKANIEDTDERPSEITNYGKGLITVFSGKVVTCVDIAQRVSNIININLK
ncbi:MAG: FAD-dependent oxidoreductase [Nanoarchaeota archaeon]